MKKTLLYSAFVLLLAAAACNKTENIASGDGQIRFSPFSEATRALIENEADLQAATFQVYDFLNGSEYINETISYADGAWNYASGNTYTWKSGTHKLFGYTAGAGTLTDNVLTVSKTLTTADADQVDLLYSEIVKTTDTEWKTAAGHTDQTPVTLNLKHMLSAVSITLKNCTDYDASVTKVTAPAIPNAGSATVSYAGDKVDVTYGAVSASGSFVSAAPISSATALASQKSIDVLKMAAADAKGYQMVWPQTLAKDAVTVTVSYTLNGTTYTDKTVTLPADTWEAGKKYDYILQILPSDIHLKFVVQPWDAGEAGAIDTSTGSINMSNVTWMNTKLMVNDVLTNTVNNAGYSVTMYKDPYLTVTKYPADVYQTYEEDVYQTYEEDVYAEDGETIIHHAGDQVLDENGGRIILHRTGDQVLDEENNPIVLHHAGDLILDENGHQVYQKGEQYSGYYPAQGYFTVNYPKAGLFKIGLKPAVKDPQGEYFDASKYEILIYDNTIANPEAPKDEQHPVGFRAIDPDGEDITNNTVYFRIAAAANQDGAQHKAQINIWFKAAQYDETTETWVIPEDAEWVSAYSEIRANYALVIPATN